MFRDLQLLKAFDYDLVFFYNYIEFSGDYPIPDKYCFL